MSSGRTVLGQRGQYHVVNSSDYLKINPSVQDYAASQTMNLPPLILVDR